MRHCARGKNTFGTCWMFQILDIWSSLFLPIHPQRKVTEWSKFSLSYAHYTWHTIKNRLISHRKSVQYSTVCAWLFTDVPHIKCHQETLICSTILNKPFNLWGYERIRGFQTGLKLCLKTRICLFIAANWQITMVGSFSLEGLLNFLNILMYLGGGVGVSILGHEVIDFPTAWRVQFNITTYCATCLVSLQTKTNQYDCDWK